MEEAASPAIVVMVETAVGMRIIAAVVLEEVEETVLAEWVEDSAVMIIDRENRGARTVAEAIVSAVVRMEELFRDRRPTTTRDRDARSVKGLRGGSLYITTPITTEHHSAGLHTMYYQANQNREIYARKRSQRGDTARVGTGGCL
jgi:hypothetical protein